jgi:hypothetical protein
MSVSTYRFATSPIGSSLPGGHSPRLPSEGMGGSHRALKRGSAGDDESSDGHPERGPSPRSIRAGALRARAQGLAPPDPTAPRFAHLAARGGRDRRRKTARGLGALAREGWTIVHDLQRRHSNFDHVAVGPGGVFLLDSKNLHGQAGVMDGGLFVRGIDDPEDLYSVLGMSWRMRRQAVRLKKEIEAATGIRAWVHPVVVLCGQFPDREAFSQGVTYLHVDVVAEWLRRQVPRLGAETQALLAAHLEQTSKEGSRSTP